jgi:uncharacterized protein YcfL
MKKIIAAVLVAFALVACGPAGKIVDCTKTPTAQGCTSGN